MSRSHRLAFAAAAILVACSLLAPLAVAQPMQPCTTVANFHINPGQEGAFLEMVGQWNEPLFAKLMKEGAVMAWGVSTPVFHEAGGPTHSVWWTTPSMAQTDAVMAAFEALESKIAAEDPGLIESMMKMMDFSKHTDRVYRDLHFGFGTPSAKGAKPYVWIFSFKVKPGKSGEYVSAWEKHRKPLIEKLAAGGLVHAWGLSVQEIKYSDAYSHFVWVSMKDFATYEKARAMFVGWIGEEDPSIEKSLVSMLEPDGARTLVAQNVVFHAGGPGN